MIKKGLHIITACMVVISTMGISVNMHFCHDQLIDLALYSPAESCCDTSNEEQCDTHDGLSKMSHCQDDSFVVDALEDFVGSSLATEFASYESTDVLSWLTSPYNSSGSNEEPKSKVPEHYFPPPYNEVDLSRVQTYLI
jgi:hypothetical protein